MRLSALDKSAGHRELRVEALWPHKGMLVLKFAGVDSISDAELLVGSELQVPREQRAQLELGWTYVSDLVGCKVFDADREVGTVESVQFGAGEAPLLVVRAGAKEFEIPFAEAYLKGVDLGRKRIEMLLPEGILEVNAPLTADEKRDQNEGELRKRKSAGKKNRTSSGG
jgi:16S rRNA processing protein RimM